MLEPDEIELTNAERLVALAEIIREQAPCNRSKVFVMKKVYLSAFEDLSLQCTCGAEHLAWIQALCEISRMIQEIKLEPENGLLN